MCVIPFQDIKPFLIRRGHPSVGRERKWISEWCLADPAFLAPACTRHAFTATVTVA